MKRMLAAALAVTLMMGAVIAEARDHDDRDRHSRHDERAWKDKHDPHTGRHEGGHRYADDRHDKHRERYADNDRRRDRHWDGYRGRTAYAVARHPSRYHAGYYHRPAGYRHYSWHRGAHLPSAYYAPRYVVHDYDAYHLHHPPYGHRWVRVDNDVLLTAIATGVVVAVVNDLFY